MNNTKKYNQNNITRELLQPKKTETLGAKDLLQADINTGEASTNFTRHYSLLHREEAEIAKIVKQKL